MFTRPIPILLLGALAGFAQPLPNNYRAQAGGAQRPRLVSPEVHSDRRITFRIPAPKAHDVSLLFGAWNPDLQAMTKQPDGIWTLTIGPVEPEIYTYAISIDGQRMLDLANNQLKNGLAIDASVVEVPGTPPRFDQVQDVPHGAIHIHTYRSASLNRDRGLHVYVPPQYDADTRQRFPVLYLRHGFGDTDANWSQDGRAGVILDNLIAQKKAVPMLIVMTYGYTDGTWAGGSSPEGIAALSRELLEDVIPFVEKHYRTLSGPTNRAIAGLSMGGGQAFTIGLKSPSTFAYVAEFSSGLVSDADFDLDKHLPGVLADPKAVNRRTRLLYLSCGTADPRINGQRNLSGTLKARGIEHVFVDTPGGHEWKVWRHLLADFAPRLFHGARAGAR